jgi:hypothetical protein
VVLPGGAILLPLSDIPNYRQVFVVRSEDGGRSWSPPALAAAKPGSEFEEPALLRAPSGRLLLMMRDNGTRRMHQVFSDDEGRSWSPPEALPIEGYPPHLLELPDGRILCTYGWRQPDFGIRAALSADGGKSWDVERQILIRGGLPNKDLGYPATVLEDDGSLSPSTTARMAKASPASRQRAGGSSVFRRGGTAPLLAASEHVLDLSIHIG